MNISFFVTGEPKPAGSKRAFPIKRGGHYTGRVAIVDACEKSSDWKTTVAWEAKGAMCGAQPTDKPVWVFFVFYRMRPKCHYKSNGALRLEAPARPTPKPDLLKLARAVEDALSGIVYVDDSQIVTEHLEKRYTDSRDPRLCGVSITVRESTTTIAL